MPIYPPIINRLPDLLRHCTALTELLTDTHNPFWSDKYLPPCLKYANLSSHSMWNDLFQHRITTLEKLEVHFSVVPHLLEHAYLFQNVNHVVSYSIDDHALCIRFLEALPNLTHIYLDDVTLTTMKEEGLWLNFLRHHSTLMQMSLSGHGWPLVSARIIQRVVTRNKTLVQLTSPPTVVQKSVYFRQMWENMKEAT